MKKLILSLACLGFLTACPSKEDINRMTEGLTEKKEIAVKAIESKDYSLDGLIKMQDYFFDFSEKVHLLKIEPEADKNIQKLIKKQGAKSFCETFVMPLSLWEALEEFCNQGSFYKCSPEIKEYKNILTTFKEVAGPEIKKILNKEKSCN